MFKKSDNSLVSLGIGKKVIIEKWLDEMGVKNYIINDDYTIDVENNVDLDKKNLIKFPDYIQFNKVNGNFYCAENKLISLKGCPKIVSGRFHCDTNKLTSLYGCPEIIDKNFYCFSNQLISLDGCPKKVGGNFSCNNNIKQFTREDVREVCEVTYYIHV